MNIQRVSDPGSNAPENIEHAARVIGRSLVRRAVFEAVHKGRKQAKTVDELSSETGHGRQVVLNAATRLAHQGLIRREKEGTKVRYRKDPFFQANRDRVLRYVDNPKGLEALATKRRPATSSSSTVLQIQVPTNQIKAKSIIIDNITSFRKIRSTDPQGHITLSEEAIKEGIRKILKVDGEFKDWGGERNDFLTDRLEVRGRRRVAAFALKGPGMQGKLTPGKMGKNGDQIQRLAFSPAEVLIIQYHGQVADSVREQLESFAQLKSVVQNRAVWYCVVDGNDTSRLVHAYSEYFE